MINIASLYYFNLLQRLSAKYKRGIGEVLKNISLYLDEEGLDVVMKKNKVGGYEVISYKLKGVGSIQLFHKSSKEKRYYYYPSFFCDIYIEKSYLQTTQKRKKVIFLLSNIFECFDEFDEKNLLIEFHRDIEDAYNHSKKYKLRYDFININSLSEIYSKKDISKEIKNFVTRNSRIKTMSSIKNNSPEVYRTLLFFVYNIFAMQKAITSSKNELKEIQDYEKKSGENMHISISEERLKLNQASLQKTLTLYKSNFENFLNIMMYKD